MPEQDEMLFKDDEVPSGTAARLERMPQAERWKLLVVDDEEEVHHVTRLVLGGFSYAGRKIQFLGAYSADEAKKLLVEHPDIAVILLDVVMESHDSGLKLVEHIRKEMKNAFVRIILRTGQPGYAPEAKVIVEYDINDYKEKTEITAQKLLTAIISALRTYSDMLTIEANRRGLEKIIEAASDIFMLNSMEKFTSGVLTQLLALLSLGKDAMYFQAPGFAATGDEAGLVIKAACGKYNDFVRKNVEDVPDGDVRLCIAEALRKKRGHYCRNKSHVEFFESKTGSQSIIYFEEFRPLTDLDRKLIEIFFANVSIAFDNIYLNIKAEEKALAAECALRQAEISNREAMRHNAQRIESLQKISRAVAHQLRNPITIIAGFANLLIKKPDMEERQKEFLEGISSAAARIEEIAQAVIEFNSVRLGEKIPVFLPDFLARVRAAAEGRTADLFRTVDWMVESEPLRAPMDERLMTQALAAVLENAIEALDGPRGWIRIAASQHGDMLRIEVQDDGRGIPAGELEYVLDPFYSTKTVGVGMGLSKAERIVQEHNGSLAIRSQPGAGTTVEILLPLAREAVA